MRKKPLRKPRDPFAHRYRFTLGAAFMIMLAVLLPGRTFNEFKVGIPYIDKLVHLGMFFVFCTAFSLEFRRDRGHLPRFLPLIGLLAAFALFTEMSQLFADGRSFDLFDGLADLFGAVMARVFIGVFDHIGEKPVSGAFRSRTNRKKP